VLVAPVAAKPTVSRPGYRILWQRWCDVCLLVVVQKGEEILKLARVKAGQFEAIVGRGEFL
jgi:hypothetical protein